MFLPQLRFYLRPYSELMRWDQPVGTLLLLWPTYWALWLASAGTPNLTLLLVFTVGTFLMRSAGCVVNDFADRDFDHQVERTKNRPLTSGLVSPRAAILLLFILLFLALLCLLPLNALARSLSLIAVFFAVTYPFMKRFFSFPQFYLGLAFSCGILMAYAAVLNTVPVTAWLLYGANILWILAYDTVYALADKPDDLKINIHSSAITLGQYDIVGVMVFDALFVLVLIIVGFYDSLTTPYFLALIAASVLLIKQYFFIRDRDRERCYRAFLQNNEVGFFIFIGIAAHFWFLNR